MVLQAVAHQAHGEKDEAAHLLGDALALAEPGGFIRLFVDEGAPMAQLLSEATAQGIMRTISARCWQHLPRRGRKSEDRSLCPLRHLPNP